MPLCILVLHVVPSMNLMVCLHMTMRESLYLAGPISIHRYISEQNSNAEDKDIGGQGRKEDLQRRRHMAK